MNLSAIEIIDIKEVPTRGGYKKIDYKPLFRKVAAMVQDNDVLRIPVRKQHEVNNIQRAIDNEFGKNKYKAFRRTIKGQLYCFVTKR